MSELKKCPFCGSKASYLPELGDLASCSKEGCIAWPNYHPIKQWNTRPIEDALRTTIAELRDENYELRKALTQYDANWGVEI